MRTLCSLVLTSVLAAQAAPPAPAPRHLVQVLVRDAHTLDRLMRLDLDLAGCTALEIPARRVDVIATAADIERLRAAGLEFEVAIENLEQHYARELARHGTVRTQTLTPPLGQGSMGGHYTLAEITAILDSFANDYPGLCSPKVSIGRTHEGRDIWMVKISDNVGVDENEPEVLFDGMHHAREAVSAETILLFMEGLLSGYATDPEARFLIDNRELYFVPVVNPDGYEYNRTTNPNGGGLWRKNRRPNGGGSFGVDINRNYPTGWNAPNGGNSTNPNSETYRGPAPLSEPETAALDAFLRSRQFVQGFSCHTYTDVLLRPWGYQNGNPPNAGEYNRIGARATARNGLAHGATSTLLYIAAGSAVDDYHVRFGMYGWTPELGRANEGGFWPNPTQTVAIATRNQHMLRQIALTSGALLALDAVQVTEAGGNQNQILEPGETGHVVATVRNDGAAAFVQPVQLTLTALSPGVTVGTGGASAGAVAKFSTGSNASTPLTFAIPAGYPGLVVELRLVAAGDGQSAERTLRVPLAPFRVAVDDDMEADRGFERGPSTATTGLFERAAPQQTTNGGTVIQPGSDHSPAGTLCWVTDGRAGSSAGSYDVDNGTTVVLSPVYDLTHAHVATVTFWRWYAESVRDDAFEVAVSNDGGGSWTPLLASAEPTNGWVRESLEIPIPLTARMVFRFHAQDLNASLVEALIDDFAVEAVTADGAITLQSSGRIGTVARIGLNGRNGALGVPMLAAGAADLPVPGVAGRLLLAPDSLVFLPAVQFSTQGYAGVDIPIPGAPALRGGTLYLQQLHVASPNDLALGNRQTLTLR